MVEHNQVDIQVHDIERRYLLEVYQRYFPDRDKDVIEEMAGCRVLPEASGSPFKRSREMHLEVDDPSTPRVISMFGGKLTVYRRSALKVVEQINRALPERRRKADTASLPLAPVADNFRF